VRRGRSQEGSVFFSEEKNQKTFTIPPLPRSPAMAGKPTLAQN
jgi:hypothetical protein